jgi:hypothetical protein
MFGFGDRQFEKLYQFRVKSITSVDQLSEIPVEFALSQNYPNPFNPETTIKIQIISTGHTSLKVYDILGREVTTLINKSLKKGSYSVEFDGAGLTSGTYFYRLQSGQDIQVKKLVLLK